MTSIWGTMSFLGGIQISPTVQLTPLSPLGNQIRPTVNVYRRPSQQHISIASKSVISYWNFNLKAVL